MSYQDLHLQDNHLRDNHAETVDAYMSKTFIALSGRLTVAESREYILHRLPDDQIPTQVFIIDGEGYLQGQLRVKLLFTETELEREVAALMHPVVHTVTPEQQRQDVALLLSSGDLTLVPVVGNGKLLGVLTEREIAALTKDEATEDAQRQGASLPLDQPYLSTSPVQLWRKRIVWLLLLFVAEAYTSTVLQAFEAELEAAIALAFFIPLLIGTGGNSGTQITSTLVRAMALGEVSLRNLGSVLKKEVPTSLMVAGTIAIVAWVRAWILGVGPYVTITVCLTLIAITLWSAIVSSTIPMVLKRLKVDPAVVSAPFIATFIDGTGLIIYFEIARLVMPSLAA